MMSHLVQTVADKRDVIEIPFDGELDINGWDIRKSLKLLRKSNSPLHEWLSSPIKYRIVRSVMNAFVELSADAFLPDSSCHHYLSMAQNIINNFREIEEVRIKSYLYSLFFEEYLESQLKFVETILKNPKKIPIEKFDSVFQNILSESKI